jgi:hypothetical protein
MVYDEGGFILWVCNPDHDDVVYCLGYSPHDLYRQVLPPIQKLCRQFLLEHCKGSLFSTSGVVGDVKAHACPPLYLKQSDTGRRSTHDF